MSMSEEGGNVLNPQSLNRYAYVDNNPASLTDPLGLDFSNPADPCSGTGWEENALCAGPTTQCAPGDIQCQLFYLNGPLGIAGGGGGGGGGSVSSTPPAGQPPLAGEGPGDPWVSSTIAGPGLYCRGYGGAVFRAPGDGAMPCFQVFVLTSLPTSQGNKSTVKQPPPSGRIHTGKYWDYFGCVVSEGILLGFNNKTAAATVGLNVAALALGEVPIVNVAAVGVATYYDLKLEFEVREICMEEVYGHP